MTWVEAFELLEEKLKPVLDAGEPTGDDHRRVAVRRGRLRRAEVRARRPADEQHRPPARGRPGRRTRSCGRTSPTTTCCRPISSSLVVCDLREELPILFLRMRIAATKRGLPIAIVHPREVSLSEYAVVRVQPLAR